MIYYIFTPGANMCITKTVWLTANEQGVTKKALNWEWRNGNILDAHWGPCYEWLQCNCGWKSSWSSLKSEGKKWENLETWSTYKYVKKFKDCGMAKMVECLPSKSLVQTLVPQHKPTIKQTSLVL